MKKPLLELIDVTCSDGAKALRRVNLTIYEGEFAALVGADGSGKVNILRILSGVCPQTGEVRFLGAPYCARNIRESQRARVFYTTTSSHLLDELTIGENMATGHSLVRPFAIINEKLIRCEAQAALERFGVHLSQSLKVKELTKAQKLAVELIKFHMLGAKLVAILALEAVSTPDEDALFLRVIDQLTKGGAAILLIVNQFVGVLNSADRLYLLSTGGRVAHEYRRGDIDRKAIEEYLSRGAPSRIRVLTEPRTGPPVLSVRGLTTSGARNVNFDLNAGQVLGLFYPEERRGCDSVALALVGAAPYVGQMVVDGKPVSIKNERDAFKLGLALLPSDPRQLYFPDLTTAENIEVPFWPRAANALGVLRRGLRRPVLKDGEASMRSLRARFRPTGYNDCIYPVLTRFRLYPFRVIVMMHPSAVNDAVKAQMLYDLVEEASARGCALIVASTRMAELKALCTDIYTIE